MKASKPKLIVVLGPTATGKTKLAAVLALKYNGKIISADSRQVFRGMDIGTGKDLADYQISQEMVAKLKSYKQAGLTKIGLKSASRALKMPSGRGVKGSKTAFEVPYALIDIIEPMTGFNVAKYQKLAKKAINEAISAGQQPLLVGGTGLYIDAVIKNYNLDVKIPQAKLDAIRQKMNQKSLAQLLTRLKNIDPETYSKVDKKNRRRVQRAVEIYELTGQKKSISDKTAEPDYELLILGIGLPLMEIYRRIDSRLEARLKEGMVREIKKLRASGVSWKRLEEFGLEYRYVSRYLRGLISYDQMLGQLKNEIHHFAKRQLTWFKRNPDIRWVKNLKEADRLVGKFLD